MVGWHHQLNGHEFEQTPGESEGQGSLVCCSPWGRRVGHQLATEQQQSSESNYFGSKLNHNYYYKTCYAHPYHKLLLSKGYPPSIYLSSATVAAKSLQSCPTLCDPIDGSPPGSAIPGILQARILEWGAIAFSDIYHLSICKYDMELTEMRKVKIDFQIQTITARQPPAVMTTTIYQSLIRYA